MHEDSCGAVIGAVTRGRRGMEKLAILLSAMLLGACGDTQTAFVIEGDANHSLTVIREQAYVRGPWQTTLVVAGVPRCQRRYPMDEPADGQFRVAVHRPEPGVFIINAGKRWYVAEVQDCGFQAYKTPPPVPGELVGNFEMKEGALRYSARTPAASSGASAPRAAGVAR